MFLNKNNKMVFLQYPKNVIYVGNKITWTISHLQLVKPALTSTAEQRTQTLLSLKVIVSSSIGVGVSLVSLSSQ
jgi:hypothetical protein